MENLTTVAKPKSNSLAGLDEERQQWRKNAHKERERTRKIGVWQLKALTAFANMDDTPQGFQKFQWKYRDFEPFEILDTENKRVSVMAPRFHSMILAWRDLLRCVWRGQAQSWELETLLGLNPDGASRPWGGDASFVELWNSGLHSTQVAGFHFPPYYPVIRSHWNKSDFTYESAGAFQNAVYALWRKGWSARVCLMCEKYFIARKGAQRYCSKHCSQEGKNERNREWWKESGPDWRERFRAEKANTELRGRRKKGAK